MRMILTTNAAVLLLIFHHISLTRAWCHGDIFVRKCKAAAATALIFASQNGLPVQAVEENILQPPPPPVATMSSQEIQQKLGASLQHPTEDTPQIKLTQNFQSSADDGPKPIVQGLVYLVRPNSEIRPYSTDTLVLTAGSLTTPDDVLAGAKIPVSRLRFPTSFRMYKENILSGKTSQWYDLEESGEILVKAKICPDGIPLPCSDDESTLKAQGVSKKVRNLPGLPDGTNFRAAASLPLQ
mmetsp:Transcript_28276/g.39805  ORF Transcript_28276/g.39805 Transcript_28276/m.39805 type:complete len:240 (-) Transcript_28276:1270-1989(-)